MLKLSLNRMESIKGREGLQGKEAEKAISQVKIAAGGELAEEVHPYIICGANVYGNKPNVHAVATVRRPELSDRVGKMPTQTGICPENDTYSAHPHRYLFCPSTPNRPLHKTNTKPDAPAKNNSMMHNQPNP